MHLLVANDCMKKTADFSEWDAVVTATSNFYNSNKPTELILIIFASF